MGKKNKHLIWKREYERDRTGTICTGNPIPYVPPPFEMGDVVKLKSPSPDDFDRASKVKSKKEYVVVDCCWEIGHITPHWVLYLEGIGNAQPGMRSFKKNPDGSPYKNEKGHCEHCGPVP